MLFTYLFFIPSCIQSIALGLEHGSFVLAVHEMSDLGGGSRRPRSASPRRGNARGHGLQRGAPQRAWCSRPAVGRRTQPGMAAMANARRSPRRPPRFTGAVILLAEDIIIIDDDKDEAAPLPSPTPAVVEVAGNALAMSQRRPKPPSSLFGSGSAFVDAVAARRLPSTTPATPPPSPRSSARRRLVALGLPLPSPPSSSHGHRAGTWSPAALGLANGVAPGNSLPGDSSVEDARGRSGSHRR